MTKKKKPGDDEVGFLKPPRHGRFQKGRSGNPRGRPPDKKRERVDIIAVLDAPVTVSQGGLTRQISSFEASVRKLAVNAIKHKKIDAILDFLKLCERHNMVQTPPPPPKGGGVLIVPKTWDSEKWEKMLKRHGAPPWPGKRSGLPGDE